MTLRIKKALPAFALFILGISGISSHACDVSFDYDKGDVDSTSKEIRELAWGGGEFKECGRMEYGRVVCGGKEIALIFGRCNDEVAVFGNSGQHYCTTENFHSKVNPVCKVLDSTTRIVTDSTTRKYLIEDSDMTFMVRYTDITTIKKRRNPSGDF